MVRSAGKRKKKSREGKGGGTEASTYLGIGIKSRLLQRYKVRDDKRVFLSKGKGERESKEKRDIRILKTGKYHPMDCPDIEIQDLSHTHQEIYAQVAVP